MNNARARIVFAGTPAFAVPTLKRIAVSGHVLAGVLTQPDRPAGRGQKLQASPVKAIAGTLDVPILQPANLQEEQVSIWLEKHQPDLMVIVAYGLILPREILRTPACGCVNVHASLLPRWRGASPIQAAILHGDQSSGISIMRMEAGLDTGPVYATREIEIGKNETADELHDRLAELGARCLIEVLPGLLDMSLPAQPQDDSRATYAGRIVKADATIDWGQPAAEIHNKIRAYNSWPVAETLLDGKRLRCWMSENLTDEQNTLAGIPGTVVAVTDSAVRVQTALGQLDLTELQLPGRQRVPAVELARGYGESLLGKQLGTTGK